MIHLKKALDEARWQHGAIPSLALGQNLDQIYKQMRCHNKVEILLKSSVFWIREANLNAHVHYNNSIYSNKNHSSDLYLKTF